MSKRLHISITMCITIVCGIILGKCIPSFIKICPLMRILQHLEILSKRLINILKEVDALHLDMFTHSIQHHTKNINTKFHQNRPINEHFTAILNFVKEVNEEYGQIRLTGCITLCIPIIYSVMPPEPKWVKIAPEMPISKSTLFSFKQ